MVLVWLEEEVVPNCAGGGERRVGLIAWPSVGSCFCLQEALPGFLSFPSSASTLLEALELYPGPESDSVNSDIAIAGWYLRLGGGWAWWAIQAQRKRVTT